MKKCGAAPRFYIARFTVERVGTGVLDRPYKSNISTAGASPRPTVLILSLLNKLGFVEMFGNVET